MFRFVALFFSLSIYLTSNILYQENTCKNHGDVCGCLDDKQQCCDGTVLPNISCEERNKDLTI